MVCLQSMQFHFSVTLGHRSVGTIKNQKSVTD